MERANSSISCFRADCRLRSDRPDRPGLPAVKEDGQDGTSPVEAIYCRVCEGEVTSRNWKIAVQGSHAHTFFNPAGIVFELGCFKVAPGCRGAGEATSDFTWFAGYVWSFALCRHCNSHLGWFFEKDEHSFFGLIFANIKE
jgi:hypothetical protein